MNFDDQIKSPDEASKEVVRETVYVFVVIAAVVFVLAAYAVAFFGPVSRSGQVWASFGDYVSGVANPIIGIATVVLIARTLKVTRAESAYNRSELQKQVELLGRQFDQFEQHKRLAEMQKRMDGVMADWSSVVDRPGQVSIAASFNRANRQIESSTYNSRKDLLFALGIVPNLESALAHGNNAQSAQLRAVWATEFATEIRLLKELGRYCQEYQEMSRDSSVADYYRLRVAVPVRVLDSTRQFDDDARRALNVRVDWGLAAHATLVAEPYSTGLREGA